MRGVPLPAPSPPTGVPLTLLGVPKKKKLKEERKDSVAWGGHWHREGTGILTPLTEKGRGGVHETAERPENGLFRIIRDYSA